MPVCRKIKHGGIGRKPQRRIGTNAGLYVIYLFYQVNRFSVLSTEQLEFDIYLPEAMLMNDHP